MDVCSLAVSRHPEIEPYMVSTEPERDWVLFGAAGYFAELEKLRLPSQRISASSVATHDLFVNRLFANYSARNLLNRSLRNLAKNEDGLVELEYARRKGFNNEEDLLCLAAVQYAYSTRVKAQRFFKQDVRGEPLWEIYIDFMCFCHSHAYTLQGVYEEKARRQKIDRTVKRDPRDSYAEWRNKASPAITELHPRTLQFTKTDSARFEWREDRSAFHKAWIKRKLDEAWTHGYKPFSF